MCLCIDVDRSIPVKQQCSGHLISMHKINAKRTVNHTMWIWIFLSLSLSKFIFKVHLPIWHASFYSQHHYLFPIASVRSFIALFLSNFHPLKIVTTYWLDDYYLILGFFFAQFSIENLFMIFCVQFRLCLLLLHINFVVSVKLLIGCVYSDHFPFRTPGTHVLRLTFVSLLFVVVVVAVLFSSSCSPSANEHIVTFCSHCHFQVDF